jgi:DNA polymerase III delta prime subunit
MEEYSSNCGFILTCNFKNRIISPLHSRCSVVDFKIAGKETTKLATQFLQRVYWILSEENITYDKKVVAQLITKFFPDWRRVLNELQRYAASGSIDSGILAQVADVDMKDMIKSLKEKDFASMRKWVAINSSMDANVLFRKLYDSAYDILKPESIPTLVLIIADYQYKAAFVVDQEINIAACLTNIMADCQFK